MATANRDLMSKDRMEERYESFVMNSSEAIWCIDFDEAIPLDLPPAEQLELCYRHARVTEVNETWCTIYRTPRDQIVGKWRLQNFLPRSLPTSEPFVMDAIRSRYQMSDRETIERTEGGLDLVFLNSTTPEVDDGRLVRLWGVSRDITALRSTESELRTRKEELEALKERLEAENVYLQEELREGLDYAEIVGESEPWLNIVSQLKLVAATESTVLLGGETGTGKELLARALHTESSRGHHPLIKVNCAALPSTLIESELFGHEKGAFSGADRLRQGRFELADRGTIFLDEVGELPVELQGKLLHVLQTGEFERVGSSKTLRTDARVIAATNRHLLDEVEAGRFRSDLYYRLAVFPIEVPPLRHRRDDVPLLATYFLARQNAKHGKSIQAIPRSVMDALAAYDWPGNVRELENLIERAVILTPGETLRFDMATLGGTPRDPVSQETESAPVGPDVATEPSTPASVRLEDVERAHIRSVVESCGWKIKGVGNAAEQLGLKEGTLRSRMKKLGIRRPVRS
jgi:transcriptional regulator with GAF, ATPase, and Fis domain